MSVQLLCPNCASVTELHRPPVTDCAHCHTAYPSAIQRSAEDALRHGLAPKPVLLLLGQWFSLLSGSIFTLLLALAPFDLATYSIEGEPVSGAEFLRRGGIGFGAIAVVLFAIGIGLLRDKAWARPLMLYYWLMAWIGAASAARFELTAVAMYALSMALPACVAAWYLYGKDNVAAYFESRRATTRPAND